LQKVADAQGELTVKAFRLVLATRVVVDCGAKAAAELARARMDAAINFMVVVD